MPGPTEKVARFISSFSPETIPQQAYHTAKLAIRDTIGVALAAQDEPAVQVLRAYVEGSPGARQSTMWGSRKQFGALEAALVNGTAAHALDYDDLNRSIGGHPTTVIAPAVFAVGERLGASGQQVLDAYVLGFEVMAKLGQVLNPGLYVKGWHPTSVLGVMGACAACCRLMGLTCEQVVNALGIAASEASGIKKNFGSMTKPFHAGSAARKGLWAAELAQQGLTADQGALEGGFGYLELFSGDLPFNLAPLDRLGDPFDLVESGLAFKQYPCCGSTHPSLDCALEIKQHRDFAVDQIVGVECWVNPQRLGHINRPVAQTPLQAKFSLQCVTALALVDGFIGLGQFASPTYLRPVVQDLMTRVILLADDSMREYGARVVVQLLDGSTLTAEVPEAKGSPAFPIPDDDLERKFVDCASTIVDEPDAQAAARVLMNLEREPDLKRVLAMIVATPDEDECC
jgi:2-methylcitrate dehydratase PrpD